MREITMVIACANLAASLKCVVVGYGLNIYRCS